MASASENENPIDIENAALFDEIIELLGILNQDPEVVMLIGKTGAGKSAMLNTIHRVLTGQNFNLAKQGSGNALSVTLDLGRYDNCGINPRIIKDDSRRDMVEAILSKLPHILDCAGLGDFDSPGLREILELLVGGFIPKNTHIKALEAKQKEYGVGCLKKIYPTANPSDKVTKVVFIHSCWDTVPKNLINCLSEVLKITDPRTLKRKYTAEIFLLITKYDLVRDPTVHISTGSDEESMTLEEFVEKENELAPEFNIVGALDANRIRWASFTDKIQSNNKYIENIALKFLKRMVEPGAPPAEAGKPVVGPMKTLELYFFKLSNQIKRFFLQDMQMNLSPALLVSAIVFVVVIAVLYKLLSTDI